MRWSIVVLALMILIRLAAYSQHRKLDEAPRVTLFRAPARTRLNPWLIAAPWLRMYAVSGILCAALKNDTWHCNRHAFASRLVMAGVDMHTVGKLLGRRTAEKTKRDAHHSVNHKQSALDIRGAKCHQNCQWQY